MARCHARLQASGLAALDEAELLDSPPRRSSAPRLAAALSVASVVGAVALAPGALALAGAALAAAGWCRAARQAPQSALVGAVVAVLGAQLAAAALGERLLAGPTLSLPAQLAAGAALAAVACGWIAARPEREWCGRLGWGPLGQLCALQRALDDPDPAALAPWTGDDPGRLVPLALALDRLDSAAARGLPADLVTLAQALSRHALGADAPGPEKPFV